MSASICCFAFVQSKSLPVRFCHYRSCQDSFRRRSFSFFFDLQQSVPRRTSPSVFRNTDLSSECFVSGGCRAGPAAMDVVAGDKYEKYLGTTRFPPGTARHEVHLECTRNDCVPAQQRWVSSHGVGMDKSLCKKTDVDPNKSVTHNPWYYEENAVFLFMLVFWKTTLFDVSTIFSYLFYVTFNQPLQRVLVWSNKYQTRRQKATQILLYILSSSSWQVFNSGQRSGASTILSYCLKLCTFNLQVSSMLKKRRFYTISTEWYVHTCFLRSKLSLFTSKRVGDQAERLFVMFLFWFTIDSLVNSIAFILLWKYFFCLSFMLFVSTEFFFIVQKPGAGEVALLCKK